MTSTASPWFDTQPTGGWPIGGEQFDGSRAHHHPTPPAPFHARHKQTSPGMSHTTRPPCPRYVLVSRLDGGDMSIGHAGDTRWRVTGLLTAALNLALAPALNACELPDIPRSPRLLLITITDGLVRLGPDFDNLRTVPAELADPIQQAITDAIAERAQDLAPWHQAVVR